MKQVDLGLESGYHRIKSVFYELEAEFSRFTLWKFWDVYQISVFPEPTRERGILCLVIRIPHVWDEAHDCIVEKTSCERRG